MKLLTLNRVGMIVLLLAGVTVRAQTSAANGFCQLGGKFVSTSGLNSTTKVQASYPKCTVTVYLTGTVTLATLTSNAIGTPLTNPFQANVDGSFLFYAPVSACYDVVTSVSTSGGTPPMPNPFTYTDICLGGGGGGGGGGVTPGTPYQITRYDPTGTNIQNSTGSDNPVNGSTQWPSGLSVENNAGYRKFPNSANGTTLNLTVCYDPASPAGIDAVMTCPAGSNNALGIADIGAGTTGNVKVAMFGFHAGIYDGQTVINDWFGPSATTPGYLTDLGPLKPQNTEVMGHVTSLNSGAATLATSDLFTGDTIAPGGGGSVTTQTCAQVGGIAAFISSTILGCDTSATTDFSGHFLLKSAGFTDATHAGFYYLTQGPIPAPVPANSVQHFPSTSIPTAFSMQEPSAPGNVGDAYTVLSNTTDSNGHTINQMGFGSVLSNLKMAVQAATVTVLPFTPTYANGSSGVGATLTAGSVGTLVVDGYTPALNERILVKNQASAFQNGKYQLTTLGTGGVAYVLTRVTDFNTPTQMNNPGATPVWNGTTNADTLWSLTSVVTTIGTDAENFSQFGGGTGGGGVVAHTCVMIRGADNAAALANTDIAPQGRQCFIPQTATIIEMDVAADAGTPSVVVGTNYNGTILNIVSSALATAAAGGVACSNPTGVLSLDGVTTCSATLQNTAVTNPGTYIGTTSATAGGTAKRMSIFVTWTTGGFSAGPGVINNGNANQTAYYPANGTTLSGGGPGTTGQVWTSNGAGSAPTFQAPPATSAMVQLCSLTASASTELDFQASNCPNGVFSGTYHRYVIAIDSLVYSTSLIAQLQMGTGGGPTYDTGSNYAYIVVYGQNVASAGGLGSASDTSIVLRPIITQTTSTSTSANLMLHDPQNASLFKQVGGDVETDDTTGHLTIEELFGEYKVTTALTAFRLKASTGNFTSGTVTLYGVTP